MNEKTSNLISCISSYDMDFTACALPFSFARMELAPMAHAAHVKRAIDLFSASTAETAKHALVFESLTPFQQKAVKVSSTIIVPVRRW